MASLGALLRELRLKHAASLDDLARTTKIGVRQLEALEADDLARLPASPFVKGFVRAYCEALGEPPDGALALYRAAVAAPVPGGHASSAAPARPPRGRAPVLASFVLLAVLGVALLALSLALRGGRGAAGPGQGPAGQPPPPDHRAPAALADAGSSAPVAGMTGGTPAAPSPAPASPGADGPSSAPAAPASTDASTPAAGVAPSAAVPAPTAPSSAIASPPPGVPQAASSPGSVGVRAPYRLVARASAPTWVRVRMGGGQTVEETIPGGETREWVSNSPFILTIGNAGGLALELNGQALPPLGKPGAVVSRLVVPPESP